MKTKLMIIGVLVGLFGVFLVIKFFLLNQEAASGRIRIISSPSAAVFIDNVAVGKTPHEANLKPGEYQIKLIPEGEGTKTVSWEGKVSLYGNALTYVSRELGTSELTSAGEILGITSMKDKPKGDVGEIEIETEPTGGIVYLDNDQKGIAPIRLQDVPVGDHEVSVYLPGFFRRSQKINVEKAHVLNAKFKLALDQSHKTLEEELKEKKASDEAKKKEASKEAETTNATKLKILSTPTGFLNVRDEPSVSGQVLITVTPGEEYEFSDEQNNWFKIDANGTVGWVSGDYVEKM